MSIHLFKLSTDRDDGSTADGWQLYVELFGIVIELSIAR